MKRTLLPLLVLLFGVQILILVLGVQTLEAKHVKIHSPRKGKAAETDQAYAPVRNLIYMIGDGMGLAHVAMMMIEDGYQEGPFDRMHNIALMSTYSANNRVTDSAAAGTALACGCKTNNSMLGVTPDSLPHPSIISRAMEERMSAGVVVTSEIQHATPAAFYAHVPHRKHYAAISEQLVTSGLDVAFGGGREAMAEAAADGYSPIDRLREGGCSVVMEWGETDSITQGRVVGLFAEGHLPSMLEGRGNYLPQATAKALQILSANAAQRDKGFVLMVEGSQIDMQSHGNQVAGVLAEVRDFSAAVEEAMRFADEHPGTLVVVTADHETGGLTMPSGNSDFLQSESGIEYKFSTGSHTGILVPIYLYGSGAEYINGVMDNTELSRRLAELLGVN
jgi:alkaline phosphatase